jgi:hypothetical protein
MINKIIKERRRSINDVPTRPSNKEQGAQEDPKQKQERAVHGQANHYLRINN